MKKSRGKEIFSAKDLRAIEWKEGKFCLYKENFQWYIFSTFGDPIGAYPMFYIQDARVIELKVSFVCI